MVTAIWASICQCFLLTLTQKGHILQSCFFPPTATRLPIIDRLFTLLRLPRPQRCSTIINNIIITGFLRKSSPIHLSTQEAT